MLNLAVPIAFATLAQMFMMTVNDLDLSIGAYVGLVACVAATLLVDDAGRSASWCSPAASRSTRCSGR